MARTKQTARIGYNKELDRLAETIKKEQKELSKIIVQIYNLGVGKEIACKDIKGISWEQWEPVKINKDDRIGMMNTLETVGRRRCGLQSAFFLLKKRRAQILFAGDSIEAMDIAKAEELHGEVDPHNIISGDGIGRPRRRRHALQEPVKLMHYITVKGANGLTEIKEVEYGQYNENDDSSNGRIEDAESSEEEFDPDVSEDEEDQEEIVPSDIEDEETLDDPPPKKTKEPKKKKELVVEQDPIEDETETSSPQKDEIEDKEDQQEVQQDEIEENANKPSQFVTADPIEDDQDSGSETDLNESMDSTDADEKEIDDIPPKRRSVMSGIAAKFTPEKRHAEDEEPRKIQKMQSTVDSPFKLPMKLDKKKTSEELDEFGISKSKKITYSYKKKDPPPSPTFDELII